MQPLRALIREHRHRVLALLVLAFCIKALIPAGFMVSTSDDMALTVTICSDATSDLKKMQLSIPVKEQGSGHSDSAQKDGDCAYAGLGKVALSGVDTLLLALALAFILVLGLAPTKRPSFAQISHLRPPLRGPPTAA